MRINLDKAAGTEQMYAEIFDFKQIFRIQNILRLTDVQSGWIFIISDESSDAQIIFLKRLK